MTYFISYRETGADPKRLVGLQNAIKDAFEIRQEEFYSTYFNQAEFDAEGLDWAQIMQNTLDLIDQWDVMLVILDSDDLSEGMLIEVGYCLAKGKQIIVAKNKQVSGVKFLPIASKIIEYDNLDELKNLIIDL